MVNNNQIPIEVNKKPFETVQELKNEIPSFEEFMKDYENDGDLNYDDLSSGDVGEVKGYGPCTDGRSASSCYCSREVLLRQRNTIITNINVYNNIQNIINIRFPSTGQIFKLKLIIENVSGHERNKDYNSVKEAIDSAPRIISGQDFPDEYSTEEDDIGFWATVGTLGIIHVVPNWSISSKIRNAADSALKSVIQNYQNGSKVNGWLKVEGRFAASPSISWNY